MAFDLLLPAGGMADIEVWGTLFGQQTRTRFSYENISGDVLSILTEVNPNFADQHLTSWLSICTTDFTVTRLRTDAYDPGIGVPTSLGFRDSVISQSGTVAPPTHPSNVALVLRRRVGTIGRANRGRVYTPGVSQTGSPQGRIGGTYLTAVNAACVALSLNITAPGGSPGLLKPVLVKRDAVTGVVESWQDIAYWDANDIVRSQRRRELDVGI